MTILFDVISPYPVLENLVAVLSLGDLLNLSKVNSAYRAVLHGFPYSRPATSTRLSSTSIRSTLLIGKHDSPCWENLKAKSRTLCSEPQHTRGNFIRGCRMCSMPVCEACTIRSLFGKPGLSTFQRRYRSLCKPCWQFGNPHRDQHFNGSTRELPPSYSERALCLGFCICTAKDGHLCFKCKTKQSSSSPDDLSRCYGDSCTSTNVGLRETRVCLWCDLPLPGGRSRAEARRDYDTRHLLARLHSSFERLPEDEEPDLLEEQRLLELDAVHRNRQSTVFASEDERWRRSESNRAVELREFRQNEHPRGDLPRYSCTPSVQLHSFHGDY